MKRMKLQENQTESWCCITTWKACSISEINKCLSFTSIPNYLSMASCTWIEVSTSIYPPSSLQWVIKLIGTPYISYSLIYIPSIRIELVQPYTDRVYQSFSCQSRLNIKIYTLWCTSLVGFGKWYPYFGINIIELNVFFTKLFIAQLYNLSYTNNFQYE